MNQIVALKGPSVGAARPGATPAAARLRDSTIAIEVRSLAACAAIAADWSDLAARALEPNLFAEPDFVLAAAQHLVAFRDATALLAWDGPAGDSGRRLVGLLPCRPRHRLFAPDALIGLADRHILDGAPLLDRRRAKDVVAAMLRPRDGGGLVLRQIDLEGALARGLVQAADELGLSAALTPRPRVDGTAAVEAMQTRGASASHEALARQGRLKLVEARSRGEVRDAVEIMLAMEASGSRARAGAAMLQDTREAGFLRAMTRGLARARQCRIGLLMLDERPVAAAILLGRAQRAWLYAAAEDEAYAAFAPGQVLLALLRQAAPARAILAPDDARLGELRLLPRRAPRPRDLAHRARDALRRAVLRRPRAGAAG